MIPRFAKNRLKEALFQGKIIHIPGARQVGKTTLLRQFVESANFKTLWLNGDESDVRLMFENPTSTGLKSLIGDNDIIVIDEAQRITNIGLALKIMVDNQPDRQVIATGSSAFELANSINEPLTGRKIELFLYPLSYGEMVSHSGSLEEKRMLEHRLIYGYYPEVVTNPGNRTEILKSLSEAYLYKDIFLFENIKKPVLVERLLQAIALQVGNEVSFHEVGQIIGADQKTVERYINILEKAYIIFSLASLSRNVRNEIKKGRKIYFFDNGIRNAIIRNFNPISLRQDVGALWENFLISERIKYTDDRKLWVNRYFWRTHSQQEIDYIEESQGMLNAFEFKWNARKGGKLPRQFQEHYPNSNYTMITPSNFTEFINA
jgi:predicted AAA+ superfamily ATPase